ncbi:MAG: hypothetical protein WD513_05385, partial [Balneolaceae bacterium]
MNYLTTLITAILLLTGSPDFFGSEIEFFIENRSVQSQSALINDLQLTGVVTDSNTGDPLQGATIYVEELEQGTAT